MVLDFFAQTFDMNVYGTSIADVLITPDVVKKLLSGKNLIGGRCQKVEKL